MIPQQRYGDEEERIPGRKVCSSADRREDRGAGRLAGEDACPPPHPYRGSRPRGGRGVEVERSGVVSLGIDLHWRGLQERGEDDLRQGRRTGGPFGPVQLQSRGQYQASYRLPRGREDRRESIEGLDWRGGEPEH